MQLREELKHVVSNYLCSVCKKPLFFELKGKEDLCVNPRCILCPPLRFHDVAHARVLKRQLKDTVSELKLRIIRANKRLFTDFLHLERRAVIKNLLATGQTQFEKILVIDEMLILANSLKFVGRKKKPAFFQKILKDYTKLFRARNQIEDLENLRNLLSVEKEVYLLKYWTAIIELYKSYGIISGKKTDPSEAFKYAKIDRRVKEKAEFKPGIEIEKIFEQEFDTITALKYLLEGHYRTAKQHSYDPTALDIAVLLGLFFSVRGDVEHWPEKSLRLHYERTVRAQSTFKGDYESFAEKYATSKKVAPIIVFNGSSFILDKETLLFYIHYLVGQNRRIIEGQKVSGERIIIKKKQQASKVFEEYIRKCLREYDFKGPDQPLEISEQNEKHEYDVIGVKEIEKEVVLVEAKYRDLSPSSLTGKTLVQQELFDEDNGLLVEAAKHQRRLEFFHRYFQRFKRELSLASSRDEYQVHAWMVTKQIPLISRYRQVSVFSYGDFCRKLQQQTTK